MRGDSKLVISQTNGNWKTRDEKLIPYQEMLEVLISQFDEISFSHVPRDKNRFVDALATLASMTEMPERATMKPFFIFQFYMKSASRLREKGKV